MWQVEKRPWAQLIRLRPNSSPASPRQTVFFSVCAVRRASCFEAGAMTSLRKALKHFDEELGSFATQLGQEIHELRR